MSFVQQYLDETQKVVAALNPVALEKCVDELARVRERGGRLFILGVGGSAVLPSDVSCRLRNWTFIGPVPAWSWSASKPAWRARVLWSSSTETREPLSQTSMCDADARMR